MFGTRATWLANKDCSSRFHRVASHDREKPRLLSPSDPFLRAVGVSSADGSSIKASRRDKYKQVEEFVKLVKLAVEEAQTGGHLATPSRAAPARYMHPENPGCGETVDRYTIDTMAVAR